MSWRDYEALFKRDPATITAGDLAGPPIANQNDPQSAAKVAIMKIFENQDMQALENLAALFVRLSDIAIAKGRQDNAILRAYAWVHRARLGDTSSQEAVEEIEKVFANPLVRTPHNE